MQLLRWVTQCIQLAFGPAGIKPYASAEQAYHNLAPGSNQEHRRLAACEHPYYALLFALEIDKGPHQETRKAVCQEPYFAYRYALKVDKEPRDDTRTAACKKPEWAFFYARYIDGVPRPDTRTAVGRATFHAAQYKEWVDSKFPPLKPKPFSALW